MRHLSLICVFVPCGCGQSSPPPVSVAAPSSAAPARLASLSVADLDAFIARTVKEQRAIGVTVGVTQDGRVVFSKGYGLAHTGTKAAATTETLFAIGSVTKQFTCAVALQMEEEGKLRSRERDHDPRPWQPCVRLPRLLSARLRRRRHGARSIRGRHNAFLTPERLSTMSKSLVKAGELSQVEAGPISERGGLEVSTLRLLVGATPIRTLMYRAPDGKIEEFLFNRR